MSGPSRDPGGDTIAFTFDGKALRARPGDTLAAALLANGINLVARSFKYHRPRGIMTAGVEEPNAIVTVGSFDFTWKGGSSSTYAWPGDWFGILLFFVVEFGGGALCLRDFLRPARPRP